MTAPPTTTRTRVATFAVLAVCLLALACGPFATRADAAGGDPFATVIGTVRSRDGRPVSGARVEIQGGVRFTDATGRYAIEGINLGTRDATASAPCMDTVVSPVTVAGNTAKNFTLLSDLDASGHVCRTGPATSIVTPALTSLAGDDVTAPLDLPFPFPFYGTARQRAFVSTNGYLTFTPRGEGTEDFRNGALTDPTTPLDGIFAFWDDLVIDGPGQIRTAISGVAPDRSFTIEWHEARLLPTDERITVDLTLRENGRILVNLISGAGSSDRAKGDSATTGIRNAVAGTAGQSVLGSLNTPRTSGPATEFLTDAAPVAKAGADKLVASGAGFTLDGSTSTDPDGTTGLVRRWTQTGGPATTLKTPNAAKTAVVGVAGPTTLTYRLQVIDPFGRASTDTVVVQVKAKA